MRKQEYKNAIENIAVSEEKKKEIWGRIELAKLQMNNENPDMHSVYEGEGTKKRGNIIFLREKQKRWQTILVACLALALIIPAGAYATEKVKEWYTAKFGANGHKSEVTLVAETKEPSKDRKIINADMSTNEGRLQKYIDWAEVTTFVKVEYDLKEIGQEYSLLTAEKEEIAPVDFYGKHWFRYQNDERKGKDFQVDLYYVPESVSIQERNQEGMKNLTVDGHDAYYSMEISSGSEIMAYGERFPINLYVFYPEYGYYLLYSAAENMQEKDLIAIADSITLRQVEREQADEFWLAENWEEENYEEDNRVYGTFHEKNDAVTFDGVEYSVKKVEVRDSIEGLNKSYLRKEYKKICTENGIFEKYKREQYVTGDGITTPKKKVVKTEKIQPKLIYITLEAKNTTEKMKDTWGLNINLRSIEEKEGNEYYRLTDKYIRDTEGNIGNSQFGPFYMEGIEKADINKSLKFPANSTTTFHVGFLVDEDMVEASYINLDEGCYVDEKTGHCIQGDFIDLF